jgi:hypothetical protein
MEPAERMPSPLAQRWLAWLRRHYTLPGHATHLRHQCFGCLEIQIRGTILGHEPPAD